MQPRVQHEAWLFTATSTHRVEVHRALVEGSSVLLALLILLQWDEADDRHRYIQLHGCWILQAAVIHVPTCSFQEHVVDEYTFAKLWHLCVVDFTCWIRPHGDLEAPFEVIDSDGRLSGRLLQQRREVTCRDGKTAEPHTLRMSVVGPVLYLFNTTFEISAPWR